MAASTRAILRPLLVLLLLAVMAAAAPEARAQCTTIIVNTEKVFPLADVDFTGMLVLTSSSGSFSWPFAVHNNGSITGTYDPTLGMPSGGTLDIMGVSVPLGGSAIVPGPPGFPPCLCLEVVTSIDPAGCIIITIRPVCC